MYASLHEDKEHDIEDEDVFPQTSRPPSIPSMGVFPKITETFSWRGVSSDGGVIPPPVLAASLLLSAIFFFVSLVYVENFFLTSSTVLTWRLVFTEFTLSHIPSQTLFLVVGDDIGQFRKNHGPIFLNFV